MAGRAYEQPADVRAFAAVDHQPPLLDVQDRDLNGA
jgi:hypothetical protein